MLLFTFNTSKRSYSNLQYFLHETRVHHISEGTKPFLVYFTPSPQSGSLTSLVWTPDGTQLAGAGGNGSVVFGQVIERSIEWDTFEVRTRYYYYYSYYYDYYCCRCRHCRLVFV